MPRFALALCLLLAPALAGTQSMAETARKERERREEIDKTGKSTRTLGEADLASAQGRVANEPGGGEAPGADAPEDEAAPELSPPRGTTSSEARAQAEAYWRRRATQARERVAQAQERFRRLDRMIRVGQPAMYDENGKRVMYSLSSLKRMADEAQAEVKAADEALARFLKEAKLGGALPGWLR